MASAQTTSSAMAPVQSCSFYDRKLEGKTEPSGGGERPGTRERLGF
jgi:hypothetical protein